MVPTGALGPASSELIASPQPERVLEPLVVAGAALDAVAVARRLARLAGVVVAGGDAVDGGLRRERRFSDGDGEEIGEAVAELQRPRRRGQAPLGAEVDRRRARRVAAEGDAI